LGRSNFARRLTKELERDKVCKQASRSDELRKKHRDHAATNQVARGHDLTRITDLFVTIYAVGCLPTQFNALPFTEADVHLSLLDCQRDHWCCGSRLADEVAQDE
jgi:hypothetical protein